MYCPRCNTKNADDARFCRRCGQNLMGASQQVPVAPNPQPLPGSQQVLSPQPIPNQGQKPAGSSHRNLLIGAVLVLVITVSLVVIIGARMGEKPRRVVVPLHVTAVDYDPSTDSKIPLHVTGTDVRGRYVSEDVYVTTDDAQVGLPAGTYQVSVPVSPLTESGTYYQPSATVDVTIDEDGTSHVGGGATEGSVAQGGDTIALELDPYAPGEIPRRAIRKSIKKAVQGGMPEDKASDQAAKVDAERKEAQGAPSTGVDLSNDAVRAHLNYWLSGLSESGLLLEDDLVVSKEEADEDIMAPYADCNQQRLAKWAFYHVVFHNEASVERGSFQANGISYDARVRAALLQAALDDTMGEGIELPDRIDAIYNFRGFCLGASDSPEGGLPLQDGYYLSRGLDSVEPLGIAVATDVKQVDEDTFDVTCQSFMGYDTRGTDEADEMYGYTAEEASANEEPYEAHWGDASPEPQEQPIAKRHPYYNTTYVVRVAVTGGGRYAHYRLISSHYNNRRWPLAGDEPPEPEPSLAGDRIDTPAFSLTLPSSWGNAEVDIDDDFDAVYLGAAPECLMYDCRPESGANLTWPENSELIVFVGALQEGQYELNMDDCVRLAGAMNGQGYWVGLYMFVPDGEFEEPSWYDQVGSSFVIK